LIIWISGPTGAGKTTFSELFFQRDWERVREIVPHKMFKDFASNPKKHCGPLQEAIMQSRLTQFSKMKTEHIVFDRSISEDVEIFCKLHRQNGYLDGRTFERLEKFGKDLQAKMPKPDLVLYLTSDVEFLKKRMQAVGHTPLILESLSEQMALYEDWLSKVTCEVLQVDNSGCTVNTLKNAISGNFHAK
jgi:deoxyadenosine/deoxycytidine kinase